MQSSHKMAHVTVKLNLSELQMCFLNILKFFRRAKGKVGCGQEELQELIGLLVLV